MKRWISSLLATVLAAGLVPMPAALAEEGQPETPPAIEASSEADETAQMLAEAQESEAYSGTAVSPDFTLEGPDGRYPLSDYSSKGMLLIIGSETCSRTKALLNGLNGRAAELNKLGTAVFANIGWTVEASDFDALRSAYPNFCYTYGDMYLWSSLQSAAGNDSPNTFSFPIVFVIDKDKKITYYSFGSVPDVDQLLKEAEDVAVESIETAEVSLQKTSYTYDGKAKNPTVTVKLGAKKLQKNKDFKVTYKNNKNVGRATVTITGTGSYKGKVTKNFQIKAAKTVIKANSTSLKASSLKKQAAKIKITTGKSKGKVTYQLTVPSKLKKYVTRNNGTITFKKGCPKGSVKVKVTAAAKGNYAKTVKTITIKVK